MSAAVTVEQQPVECWCGIAFTIPANLYREARRLNDLRPSSFNLWCPMGHQFSYGAGTETQRLKDELARERHRLDQVRAERDDALLKAAKSERKLKRVANGTCPECKRSFANLARHMQHKHAPAKAKL